MILALDQGTTACTAMLVGGEGNVLARSTREFTQHFPRPGWIEHDPDEIWRVMLLAAHEALEFAGVSAHDLDAIGITNQRETVVVWDRATGTPLAPAIVWQDRRTTERCERLAAEGWTNVVRERCGLTLDPYFSATKIEWLLQNVPGLRERGADLAFGTIDSWLAFKLTGDHVTDYSNASRTMLFDIHTLQWDGELCELFGVDVGSLPEPLPSCGVFGTTDPLIFDGAEIPLAGIAGDQQAALFGQACLRRGLAKNTYGTGSFVLLNAGDSVPAPPEGLVNTIAWAGKALAGETETETETAEQSVTYALEASIFVAGAAVGWLRDGLGLIAEAAETEALAASLSGNDGVYFVPALTGLGSPHWDPRARGALMGLTRGSSRAHLARAALEAIAYQTVDAVNAMQTAAGIELDELHVDGGAVANRWLMQFQADMLGVPVIVPEVTETTAFGAAVMAGVAVGAWEVADVSRLWTQRDCYEPLMAQSVRESLLEEWAKTVHCVRERGTPGPVDTETEER